MAFRYRGARDDVDTRLVPLLLLLLVASLATVTRSSWVGDYASNQRCGETFVEQKCGLLLLLLVASLATVTRSSWVGDYASNQRCGETFVEQKCDPGSPSANRTCSDACHYDGCCGGRCVYLGSARGCHCLP